MVMKASFRPSLLAVCLLLSCAHARGESDARPASSLVDRIEREMERLHIPGAAVAMLEDGRLAWSAGFGSADLDRRIAAGPDTRFMIGSTSKVFIALAVMQLVERGELALDDRAVGYLPELGSAHGEITLRQLLSHTAGVPRDAKRRGPSPYINHQLYGNELLELLASSSPSFAPGTAARYSNLGPALLALVVERVSGQPIETYLRTAVFDPVDMSRTGHLKMTDSPEAVDGMAAGTVWTGSRPRAAGYESRFPTGSIYSTARDLGAFMEALAGGRLIRRETLEKMWTVQALSDGQPTFLGRDGVGRGYAAALGWFVHDANGRNVVHHGGSMEGFSSQIDFDREARRTVIVLANNEAGPAGDLAWTILAHAEHAGAEGEREKALAARLEEVPFDSGRWQIEAVHSRVEEHRGRTSLHLRDGTAWVKDVELTDGVVEVDIAFTDERGFIGLLWRLLDAGNHEQFYVRPHQSGKPDANQYTPAFDGLTSWQLYHGPGYGAPVEYRFDEWNRIRIVVSGRQAEVYVNDLSRPALFIPELKRDVEAGRIGLNAFTAPARFSAFRYAAGKPPPLRSAGSPPRPPAAGAIMRFEVGDVFDWATIRDRIELPAEMISAQSWKSLGCETTGLANLGRVASRGEGQNAVFARVILDSDRQQTVGLRFGYSDRVRVFLNGRAIYAGDNGYRSRDYRYLGTIGFFDEIFLPLRAGENELWFAVGEDFGGWGLQALLESTDGITLRP